MHIGLIGGIGVAATLLYYQRLTSAVQAAGGRLECTIVHAQVDDLVRTNALDLREEQAADYSALIDRLAAAGAECVAITSLGGHFCFAETAARSALPLVSAVRPLDEYFRSKGFATVGLLGTAVVLRTKLYGQLEHTRAVVPLDIDRVGKTYTDMALAGRCTSEQRDFFLVCAEDLVARGADAVVLAGTDLNLAFDGQDTAYPVVDALDVHVDVLARLATGQTTLADLA